MSVQAQVSAKFSSLLSVDKIAKVVQVSSDLNINPNHLLAVMYFETNKTFSPSITNSIGSVGLIQFTRDKKGVEYKTIRGKRYQLEALKKMSFIEQMDVVKEYLIEAKGSKTLNTFVDVYLAVFFPLAIGKPLDYVFATSGLSASLIAKQNPLFDRNNDGAIHKGEVVDYFRQLYTSWGFDFERDVDVTRPNVKGAFVTVIIGVLVFFYTVGTLMLPVN